ncbi:MAG: hypothetical protein GX265_02095 [Mollicutes bacterium]|jgi:enolase|nr:hypothetical protein [Mollicutes bacterium]
MDNIKIKLANGEIISAELISYFELIDTSKKYIFYTKNETVENNLIKMYVSEVISSGSTVNISEKMSEEDWTNLKNIMKSILTGGNNSNIKYLEIGGD